MSLQRQASTGCAFRPLTWTEGPADAKRGRQLDCRDPFGMQFLLNSVAYVNGR